MPLLSRSKEKEKEREVREEIVDNLRKLNDRIDGVLAVLFTHEGLPVAVYPTDVMDPLDASAQASAIGGAVEKFTQSIGVSKVHYLVVSGENTSVIIVSNERYGLMAAFREQNIGLALSLAKNTLDKCTRVITE